MSKNNGELRLDIHGCRIDLNGDTEALAAQFAAFADAGASRPAQIKIELRRGEPQLPTARRLHAARVLDRGLIYPHGSVTWVDHHCGAVSRFHFASGAGSVVAGDLRDSIEIAYLMVHARLGPALERLGLVRLHALGFVVAGQATLILAPPGGGKSRLALALGETLIAARLPSALLGGAAVGLLHLLGVGIGLGSRWALIGAVCYRAA